MAPNISILTPYLCEKGVIYQSSCINTPIKMELPEKKKKKEVKIDIFFLKCVYYEYSKMFLGEAILIVQYLINQMPSHVLKFKTSIDTKKLFSSSSDLPPLPPKIIGCTVFVNTHLHPSKLEPENVFYWILFKSKRTKILLSCHNFLCFV